MRFVADRLQELDAGAMEQYDGHIDMTRKRKLRLRQQTISAAEFKAICLSLMEDVAHKKQAITITKRGKPIARLVPVEEREPPPLIGFLRCTVMKADRIDEPTGEAWDAESK